LQYVTIQPYYYSTEALMLTYNSGWNQPWGILLEQCNIWSNPDGIGALFYNCRGSINNNSSLMEHDIASDLLSGSNFTFGNPQFCYNNLDIYTDGLSSVQVNGGFFSGDPHVTTQGNVNWGYSYSVCPLGKRSLITSRSSNGNPDINSYIDNDSNSISLEAIDSLKTFIHNNPFSEQVKKAFRTVINFYKGYDIEEMGIYLQEIINDPKYGKLKNWAKRHLIDYHNSQNEPKKSLEVANEILSEEKKDTLIICEALLEKATIFEHTLKNKEKAEKTLKEIVDNYPNNPLAIFAKKDLTRLGVIIKEDENTLLKANETVAIKGYPNPFNPVITLSYQLLYDSRVKIKVYDILGREVSMLVNEQKKAGYYTVMLDGSNLPSGLYFVQCVVHGVSANPVIKTEKILLTK